MSTPHPVVPPVPVLEPAARAFSEATSKPPFLFELPPAEGRAAVDDVQSGEIAAPEVDEEWLTVEGGPTGSVPVRLVRPAAAGGVLPVVLYVHGAGWVFGDAGTHDRLVRELAVGPGRGRVPRVRPFAGGPLSDRSRAGLRGGAVGDDRRCHQGSGRGAPRRGR